MSDREQNGEQGYTRRQFIAGGMGVPLAMVLAGGLVTVPFLKSADGRGFQLRPPGALDEKRFLGACIRCGKCVHVCPFNSIKLAGPDAGVSVGTPVIRPREEPCYLCPDFPCARACPSGALDSGLREIEKVRMGTAVIVDRENCLSLRGLRCEVCYSNCPLIDKAITIEARHNERTGFHSVMEPVVHREKCVGCGICEKTCVREKPVIVVQKTPPKLEDHYDF